MSKVPTADTATCIQARIRRALVTAPTLTRTLQSGRAVLHFGPWRHAARALIRMARPPQGEAEAENPLLLQIDTTQVVAALRADGIAMAGTLPSSLLNF